MNPIPKVCYDDEDDTINTAQIIKWMNEWSGGEESRVPRFKKTKNRDQSDVRIEFSGEFKPFEEENVPYKPWMSVYFTLSPYRTFLPPPPWGFGK